MKTFTAEPKQTQAYPTLELHDNRRPVQASPAAATHDDIARRAYEIYLKSGLRQGQSEKNWYQAEHELRNEKIEESMQR